MGSHPSAPIRLLAMKPRPPKSALLLRSHRRAAQILCLPARGASPPLHLTRAGPFPSSHEQEAAMALARRAPPRQAPSLQLPSPPALLSALARHSAAARALSLPSSPLPAQRASPCGSPSPIGVVGGGSTRSARIEPSRRPAAPPVSVAPSHGLSSSSDRQITTSASMGPCT